jgi:hypothetical protein
MMGGVSPETCWASYKYRIIKFYILLHLFGFFFVNCTIMHGSTNIKFGEMFINLFNPLNAELNPICHLLALLVHHFLHVSSIRVKSLTLRLLMSYIYIYIYIYI